VFSDESDIKIISTFSKDYITESAMSTASVFITYSSFHKEKSNEFDEQKIDSPMKK
jgi:hypothetical protein